MALHRAAHLRAAGVGTVRLHLAHYVTHEALIAAGVALGIGVQADGGGLAAGKFGDGDLVPLHIAGDLAVSAHDLHGTSAVPCECAHGKGGRGSVFKFQIHHLMIHHIVVAAVDAAAVGPGLQRLTHGFVRIFQTDHLADHRHMHALVAQIDALGVIGASIGGRASVQTAGGRAVGSVLGAEMPQTAERRYFRTVTAHHPQQDVHIVAALGQDHGAGLVFATPVAAHKAVHLMPVGHVLDLLDALHLPDHAGIQDLFHLAEERRVAQHMADGHQPACLLGPGLQRAQLVGMTAHRFFHHHMISCIQRSHRGGNVLIILSADESAVCQFGTGEQFAPVRRSIFRRDPVVTAELGAAGSVRLSHRHKADIFGVAAGKRTVYLRAALARADEDRIDGMHHVIHDSSILSLYMIRSLSDTFHLCLLFSGP